MKIKGKVSRTFHSMDSGFKIMALEISRDSTVPEKFRNPDFPMNVSIVGNLKKVQDEYVVELTGEWEHRENGRYWPWQFKVERYTVRTTKRKTLRRRTMKIISYEWENPVYILSLKKYI